VSAAALPRFLFAGECALVVEYGDRIDPAIHDRVLALDRAVAAAAIPGLRESVPTYRSLLIDYDPEQIAPEVLIDKLRNLPLAAAQAKARPRRWIVPACYDPTLALDLGYVAQKQGLTPEKLVALHSGAIYRLYMYGFAPGFAYLGGLPKALDISRRTEPRPTSPPNCLLIAGGQALITTVVMPTGWHIVGRTPERFFAPDRQPVFLAAVGDEIAFEAVDAASFASLEARAAAGEPVARLAAARP
jgi:KipI family sensor histidine kinase inhibitor